MLGPQHDATILRLSCIEQDLSVMTDRRRQQDNQFDVYCVYGDTAYFESEHTRRATKYAVSTPIQRALNTVYKPLRVLVEQHFSCISQIGGIVRVQLSLGAGPVGMVYPVCALVSNIHTMFYGNTVSASVPGTQNILATLSLETYLDV